MQKMIEAIEHVMVFLNNIPLSPHTIKGYRNCYKKIIVFCKSIEVSVFTDDEVEPFIKSQLLCTKNGKLYPQCYRLLRRAAALLADQMQGRELVRRHKCYYRKKMNDLFEGILAEFKSYLSQSLSPGTVRITVSMIRQFLIFLEDNGVQEICQLTTENVNDFVVSIAPKRKSSMSGLVLSMKKFLLFLCNARMIQINTGKYLTPPAPRRRKLLPCFTESEVNDIFVAVDTATSMGKRDYAILKLALGLGLRGVDIFGLKLQDIYWHKNEINILQSKTNVLIQLPLQADVGNAIAEYILHARPKSDSPYIFLRIPKPYDRLSAPQAGRNIIAKYMEKAGVSHEAWDGKSFHALRRTMGTRLIRAGLPLESVSEMLGQKSPDAAKSYIALNDNDLRVCCLDISMYATGKEGLA